MENQEAQVASEAVGGQEQVAPAAPELNIVDLQNLRAVVETAVKRGAFNANELSAIGSVYDRINTFLNAVTQKPADQAPTDAA